VLTKSCKWFRLQALAIAFFGEYTSLMTNNKETSSTLPTEIIKTAIERVRARNPRFSNNSLAKAVGVTSGFMSQFLNGRRELSIDTALSFSRFLRLGDQEEQLLIDSINQNKQIKKKLHHQSKKSMTQQLSLAKDYAVLFNDQAEYICKWYNVALSDLVLCKDFKDDASWIARRLGISKLEAEQAFQRLIRMKIIECKNGEWVKNQPHIQIPTKKSKPLIREYHAQTMARAITHMNEKVSEEDFNLRSIRGRTIAVNPKKIQEARIYIQNFMDLLTQLLEDDNCEEVYQLNVQFFPLTENTKENL